MQSQRGEIATIITALAVVILTIGVALGVTQLKAPQKQSTQSKAQTPDSPASPPQGSCTYQSYTHVYKEENPFFFSPTEIGQMKVVNDRGGALVLDENDRSQRHYVNGEFPFDPTRKANYAENDPATLSLEGYDRSAWKVKSVFCTNRGVNGCPDQSAIDALNQRIASGSDDGSRLDGFRVNCGVDVTYGWVLTKSPSTISPAPTALPTPLPTSEPTPEPTLASCPYTSTSHVYKGTKGTPLPLSELDGTVLTVTNDRSNTLLLNQQGQSTNSFTIDPMPFDPTGASYYPKGASASVTLGKLPSNYKVKSVFCDQAPGSSQGCPLPEDLARINTAIAGGADGFKIDNFKIDCNVNTTYGWIVEPQTSGVGSMEVRVEALNYPQKTSIWDKDDNASNKPGSCSRNEPSDQRPLYLSPFKIKATCVSGACKGNKSITLKIDKRVGYANFQGITPGEYKLKMVDFDDRGYEMWEPCGDAVWKVEDGKTNQLPVMFLVNLKDGEYEEMPTEGACKNVNGYPNLVEGLSGNVCYYKDGKKEDPKPEPTKGPDPIPNSGCEELEDGDDGVCVEVVNKHTGIESVQVYGSNLNPSFQDIPLGGRPEPKFIRFKSSGVHDYSVLNVKMLGGLERSYRVDCSGVGNGAQVINLPELPLIRSQKCRVLSSQNARIKFILTTFDAKPPKPTPPVDPDNHMIGKCEYDVQGYDGCSTRTLDLYFAPYKNIDPDIVKKMSALCYKEGRTGKGVNKGCVYSSRNCSEETARGSCAVRPWRACNKKDNKIDPSDCSDRWCSTPEYSVGYFQINTQITYSVEGKTYGGCVKLNYPDVNRNACPYRARRSGDLPYCSTNPGTDACAAQIIENPPIAYKIAAQLGKSSHDSGQSFYKPWSINARNCGFL